MTDKRYVFDNAWSQERERLVAAEELLDPGTISLLERIGTTTGWTCLDVGAGGGSVAQWLSDRVGSAGHVVATDINTTLLDPIVRPNLEVRRHDAVNEDLEVGRFDLVHVRLVLEHLPERQRVLEKLVRALKPGGRLVAQAVDYAAAIPVSEYGAAEHERTQEVRLRTFSASGLDPYYGRHLPVHLRDAGLVDVGNEGRTWVMEGGSPAARWYRLSMEHVRQRLTAPDKLQSSEIDRMLELFEDPRWSAFSMIVVAAWGVRTAAKGT